jgi:hypothetical protein
VLVCRGANKLARGGFDHARNPERLFSLSLHDRISHWGRGGRCKTDHLAAKSLPHPALAERRHGLLACRFNSMRWMALAMMTVSHAPTSACPPLQRGEAVGAVVAASAASGAAASAALSAACGNLRLRCMRDVIETVVLERIESRLDGTRPRGYETADRYECIDALTVQRRKDDLAR